MNPGMMPPPRVQATLQTAAARRPGDFRIQYAAGVRMVRTDPEGSAGYFRAALALRPDDLAVINGLAHALHSARTAEEAAQHYLRAIQLDPTFALPWRDAGLVLVEVRQVNHAAKALERYLQLAPDAPEAPKIRDFLQSIRVQ